MGSTSTMKANTNIDLSSGIGFPRVPARLGSPSVTGKTEDGMNQPIPEVLDRLGGMEEQLAGMLRVCSEAYASQGDYHGALRHLRAAVLMHPQSAELRNQQGFLRYVTGDDGAIEDFQFAVQKRPSYWEAYFNMGMVYFGQGRTAEAEQNFALSAQYEQNDAEIWNNLGVARFQLGRANDARACFERAVQINPDYEEARVNLQDCAS